MWTELIDKRSTLLTVERPVTMTASLETGMHELKLQVTPGKEMLRLLVFAGSREIGRFSVHDSIADADGTTSCTLAFLVHSAGLVRLSVCICQSFHGQLEGKQLQICLVQVRQMPMPEHASEDDDLPGKSNLDFWGWTSLAWEGHGHRFRVGEDYIRRRGVIEPWKWGCNFMQTHAYAYLPWHLELVKFMHQHDFLVDEHGFPPQRRNERVNGRYLIFRVHVQGTRLLPKHLEHLWPTWYVLNHTLAFVEKWGRGFSNALREGWRGCIDGWETEEYAPQPEIGVLASPQNVMTLNEQLWKYNPGVCVGSCNHTAGYKKAHYVWLHEGYHGPNFVHVAMDAGSSWKKALPGYDDHVPMGEFAGSRSFQNPYNDIFLGYQADSRTYSARDIGNLTLPDWLIKQSHDFCRQRNLGDHTAPPSALFWLNEGARLLPEEIREYAYIACHDVPRSAVAMNLGSTGIEGRFHWLADTFEDYLGENTDDAAKKLPSTLILRQREWEPASTAVLQNNHIRLERDAQCAGGRLRFDPQGIAHFDLDSLSFLLADQVCQEERTEARQILNDNVKSMSDEQPWVHFQELAAGSYELIVKMSGDDQRVMGLHINGRLAGVADVSRQRICFCLPVATPCSLTLSPWRPEGASTQQGEEHQPYSVRLFCHEPFTAAAIHEVTTADPSVIEPAWRINSPHAPMPATLGKEGTQLLDWPVELQPGEYLLAITAKSKVNGEARGKDKQKRSAPQLRVGLDRHRYFTKHFANLPVHEAIREAAGELHAPAGYSRLGRFDVSDDSRTHVVPMSIIDADQHVLELFNPGDDVELQALRIFAMPVNHQPRLKGGAKAELCEWLSSQQDSQKVTYTLLNDQPSLCIAFPAQAKPRSFVLFGRSRYDRVIEHDTGLTLQSDDAFVPDLHVLVASPACRSMVKHDQAQVSVHLTSGKSLQVHLALDTGCFKGMSAADVAQALQAPQKKLTLSAGNKPVCVKHEGRASVQVVKVTNPRPGPYLVREKGWWRQRGAQPITHVEADDAYFSSYKQWVVHHEKAAGKRRYGTPFAYRTYTAALPPERLTHGDYLKVYTPGEDAWVLPHGFIHGVARPGFGCQYTLALGDVQGDGSECSMRVKVTRLTPYLFAPRVLFAQSIAAVSLNGRPWHYFDNDLVMLPQVRGIYHLEVTLGQSQTPSITRSAASIVETQVVGRTLQFTAALPEYVRKLPDALEYHAAITLPSAMGKIKAGLGSTITRRDDNGAIIRFKPGQVSVSW